METAMPENAPARPLATPLSVFTVAFVFTFLLVFVTTVLNTVTVEKIYASTARIKIDRIMSNTPGRKGSEEMSDTEYARLIQTELEVIRSELILRKVIETLDLNAVWGRKIGLGSDNKLKTYETMIMLKRQTDIRPVPETSLVQIRVLSDRPEEAARIANTIAQVYSEFMATASDRVRVEVVDSAYPGTRPVRPNVPLNITLGFLGGMALALAVGTGSGVITFLIRRNSRKKSAAPE
jgi:capsular polysaccharide biosynthesis protein